MICNTYEETLDEYKEGKSIENGDGDDHFVYFKGSVIKNLDWLGDKSFTPHVTREEALSKIGKIQYNATYMCGIGGLYNKYPLQKTTITKMKTHIKRYLNDGGSWYS